MRTANIFDSIERIAALMRAEERKRCAEFGLQPVHLQVLDYLLICNQYSDTPAALSKYLGMTRGTVSQTLLLMQKKGYVEKIPDTDDKRVIHLKISAAGKKILVQAKPVDLFEQASALLEADGKAGVSEDFFLQALSALQTVNQSQSFGLCKTCKHFTPKTQGGLCGLTKAKLTKADSEKICQEHTL
ncbi:MAG: MarR family transcriptional regulator [Methylococcaceae bacterium]|nr:MarR family transcriptional regulator [Methylococcaceae bacterium]